MGVLGRFATQGVEGVEEQVALVLELHDGQGGIILVGQPRVGVAVIQQDREVA